MMEIYAAQHISLQNHKWKDYLQSLHELYKSVNLTSVKATDSNNEIQSNT